jgi:hypothetical protein
MSSRVGMVRARSAARRAQPRVHKVGLCIGVFSHAGHASLGRSGSTTRVEIVDTQT